MREKDIVKERGIKVTVGQRAKWFLCPTGIRVLRVSKKGLLLFSFLDIIVLISPRPSPLLPIAFSLFHFRATSYSLPTTNPCTDTTKRSQQRQAWNVIVNSVNMYGFSVSVLVLVLAVSHTVAFGGIKTRSFVFSPKDARDRPKLVLIGGAPGTGKSTWG